MYFIVPVWNGYDVAQGSNEWKLHKRTTLPKPRTVPNRLERPRKVENTPSHGEEEEAGRFSL